MMEGEINSGELNPTENIGEEVGNSKGKKWIFIGIAIVLVGGIAFMLWPNSPVSDTDIDTGTGAISGTISDTIFPISFIYVSDENSTIIITKDNIAKTAQIRMEAYVDPAEVESTPTFNVVEFATEVFCGVMQVTFFHEEAFNEFNKRMNEWNEKDIELENEEDMSEKHLKTRLEGYTNTLFEYYMINEETDEKLSECSVTGLLEEEKVINVFN